MTSSPLAALLALSFAAPHHLTSRCGVERQDVKTLSDENAAAVDLDTVVDTSIAWLRMIPAPAHWTPTLPRLEAEGHVYRVTATLVGYKIESDQDIHVVVADAQGQTIIVEFAAPACGAKSIVADEMKTARTDFLALLSATNLPPPRAGTLFRPKTVKSITVEGVTFLDRIHGQDGVAPNGVELHPALSVSAAAP